MSKGAALVTGASGFIGRHVAQSLAQQGWDVVLLRRPASPPASLRSVEAAYEDQDALTRIVSELQPRAIFHLAGVTKGVRYEDFTRGNLLPTQALLTATKNAAVPLERFVHVSSLAAYGPAKAGKPLTEADPRAPIEHYGKSKLEAEQAVEAHGVPYTILRPGGVYGPADVDYFNLFKSVAQGWNVFFGNRSATMSMVYVDDLVDAIITAATHPATVNRGYFISDGTPRTWEEVQRMLATLAGRKVRELDLPPFLVTWAAYFGEFLSRLDKKPRLLNRQKALMGAQPAWVCSAEAAARDFQFVARTPLAQGLERAFAWYRQEGWL